MMLSRHKRKGGRRQTASWLAILYLRHKSYLGLLALILAFFMLGWGILALVSALAGQETSGLITVKTDPDDTQVSILGSGLNLLQPVSSNLLQDPSFEPTYLTAAMTVNLTNSEGLWVTPAEAQSDLYASGFFDQAEVTLLHVNEDGSRSQLDQGTVLSQTNWEPVFDQLQQVWPGQSYDPAGLEAADLQQINDIALSYDTEGHVTGSVACGNGGLLLRTLQGGSMNAYVLDSLTGDISSLDSAPQLSESAAARADEQAVTLTTAAVYLLSAEGDLWRGSLDFSQWERLGPAELSDSSAGGGIVRLPEEGSWQGFVNLDEQIYVWGSQGLLRLEEDGWSWVADSYSLPADDSWIAAASGQEDVLLLSAAGRLLIINEDRRISTAYLDQLDELHFVSTGREVELTVQPASQDPATATRSLWGDNIKDRSDQELWAEVAADQTGSYFLRSQAGRVISLKAATDQAEPFEISQTTALPAASGWQQLLPLTGNDWLALTLQGTIYITRNQGSSWELLDTRELLEAGSSSQTGITRRLAWLGNSRLCLIGDAGLTLLPLNTQMLINWSRADTAATAGDRLLLQAWVNDPLGQGYLKTDSTNQSADQAYPWQQQDRQGGTDPDGLQFRTQDEAVQTASNYDSSLPQGRQYVCLSPDWPQLKQTMQGQDQDLLQDQQVYSFSVYLRTGQPDDHGKLTLTLGGKTVLAEASLERMDQTWRRYQLTFIAPENNVQDDLWLTLNWSGKGDLYLDDCYLGLALAEDRGDALLSQQLASVRPDLLRFSYAAIGQAAVPSGYWSLNRGNTVANWDQTGWTDKQGLSLESALRQAAAARSAPWLVFDSLSTPEDMAEVMEYLAGPVSEPIGEKRLKNGSPVPWTSTLSRFIFEFTDSQGLCRSDSERAAFVDQLISAVQASSYYSQIKNQLIFVDGMNYTEGVMLSVADYHSSRLDLSLNQADTQNSLAEQIDSAYNTYAGSSPRHVNLPGTWIPELLSALSIQAADPDRALTPTVTAQAQAADLNTKLNIETSAELTSSASLSLASLTWSSLAGLGNDNAASLLTVRLDTAGSLQNQSPTAWWQLQQALTLNGLRLDSTVQELTDIRCAAFRLGDQEKVVIMNLSDQQQSCTLDAGVWDGKGTLYTYNENGKNRLRKTYNGKRQRIQLPAGGVVIIDGTY
ncbi:hypothetical protein HCH52_05145 [Oscillospiraceae bacterium HV4-5-C5C]|nr:hypothetical protein [Oscillospiraceae bacterium HV4-5-C5C]